MTSFKQALRWRQRLLAVVQQKLAVGVVFSGDVCAAVAGELADRLRCSDWAVAASLASWHGRLMTEADWVTALIPLAGNVERLRNNETVAAWGSGSPDSETEAQVIRVDETDDDRSFVLHWKCLTGLPAGLVLTQKFSKRRLRALSAPAGFHRRKRPMQSPWQWVSLRATCHIQNDRRWLSPRIADVRFTASQRTHNATILNFRYRNGDHRCPFDFKVACHFCHIGYDVCPGGVHPVQIEQVDDATSRAVGGGSE